MSSNPNSNWRNFLFGRAFGIERHEYLAVAWSFAYFFCVLSSYYVIRPVRDAMAVGSGAHTIPFLFMGTFAVTLIVSPIFGWVSSRYPRRVFLPWVYLFFIANILIFWVTFSQSVDAEGDHVWLGRVFFVWLSVFNLFVVSVFWSFMADIYTREQGRRLFGLISAGGSIGAVAGALPSAFVIDFGFENLFPISAGLLFAAVLCIRQLRDLVFDDPGEATGQPDARTGEALGGSAFGGITHVFGSNYFMAIVACSIIASLLGTALYMFAAQLVEGAITGTDARTEFYGNINLWSSVLALVVQLFIVRHVVVRFGIGRALMLLPLISVAAFALLAFDPVLAVVAFLTIARRGLGFGFSKPSTDMLYSVVTVEEKYKTKNFIDTAVYRFGDIVGTWGIQLMMGVSFGAFSFVGLSIAGVSIVMMPFAVAWVALALWLGREYKRKAKAQNRRGIQ